MRYPLNFGKFLFLFLTFRSVCIFNGNLLSLSLTQLLNALDDQNNIL